MPLKPEDIIRKNFNTTRLRGGYVAGEVDVFLEEVVAELRRLNGLVDQQQAHINQFQAGVAGDGPGSPLESEQIQLAQVRKERDALFAEMADADRKIADAREAAARAEAAKESSLEEIRARFDEDLLVLEEKVNTARADAHAAEGDSKERTEAAEQQAQVAEQHALQLRDKLAKISADVRAAATEHLGAEVVEELIPFGDGLEADPIAQSSMAAMLADRIRRDHLTSGRHEAERILGEAALERESIIAEGRRGLEDAQVQAAAIIAAAREEGDGARETARISSERLLAEAQRQQAALQERARREFDDRVHEANGEAARLVEDARLERDAVLADLTNRREGLEAKIAELDTSAREYRERLRLLVRDQLELIDQADWDR